jgi:hypothetical protein
MLQVGEFAGVEMLPVPETRPCDTLSRCVHPGRLLNQGVPPVP